VFNTTTLAPFTAMIVSETVRLLDLRKARNYFRLWGAPAGSRYNNTQCDIQIKSL